MEPELNLITSRKTIIAIVSLIAFFITFIVTISIVIPLLSNPIIKPIDTSGDSHLSQINLNDIEPELKTLLKYSYDLTPEEISKVKAVIREDTIDYTLDKNKVTSAKFIVDLNEPKLTFLVNDEINNQFVTFTCPPLDLVQDQNVFCIGYGGQSTIDANLGKYLPYSGTTKNGIEYTLWQDHDDNNRPRLEMYAEICDDEIIGDEVKASIKEWIKSHGVSNPDIIPLNMPYSYCSHNKE